MADVINLNKARKTQAKRDAKTQAAENRVTFGTPKALRDKAAKETSRATKTLDGKKLED